MNILVTGGSGYIGSHIVVDLLEEGHQVIIVDNLSNSNRTVINHIESITNKKIFFNAIDILDLKKLRLIFNSHAIDAVIHLAGVKSVAESLITPQKYFKINTEGSINLIRVMLENGVNKLVFSSSATVYGTPEHLPYRENHPLNPTHPYGQSKLLSEKFFEKVCNQNSLLKIISLRYFNPVGAHISGLIGDNPNSSPNNLMPIITQVAAGLRKHIEIFGKNYKTADGTALRDYIHVSDLSQGHIKALEYLDKTSQKFLAINLGTGVGITVLEMVNKFEDVIGIKVPYIFSKNRPGDIDAYYADTSMANEVLNWECTQSIEKMCIDSWNFQKNYLIKK